MKEHIENIKKTNINSIQQSGTQSGHFKGASWAADKEMWKSQLQYNKINNHLGYFLDEVDAAKVYNDYAAYLNQTENTNFLLNDIPGYKTVARNVPEENKIIIQEKKSSKYNGVSYDSRRKYYVSSIKLAGKTYNLGNSQTEIDCARLYNQQAAFFNDDPNIRVKYILNDIDEDTIPKNIYVENLVKKRNVKSSKYHGVSKTTNNKWVACYMLNSKKIHIGTFDTELEACDAYNKIATELNKNGCNYKVNEI
jgi:hypothetical protein